MELPVLSPAWNWVVNLPWYWKALGIIAFIVLLVVAIAMVLIIVAAILVVIPTVLVAILTLGAGV